MYYSMKNIGDDTAEKLKKLSGADEKWHRISQTAGYFGVTGIQVGPEYPIEYGLPLDEIPGFIRDSYRLTYHHGVHYYLYNSENVTSVVTYIKS